MKRFRHFIGEKDKLILSMIHRFRHINKLTLVMRVFSFFGGAFFTIGLVLSVLIGAHGEIKRSAFIAAVGLVGSHLTVQLMKRSIKRFRPYLAIKGWKVFGKPLADHSFPSGHTTSIFSIVTPFALAFPAIGIWMYTLAVMVGFSRVYLGFHYPSDVLGGVLLGVGFSAGSQIVIGWMTA